MRMLAVNILLFAFLLSLAVTGGRVIRLLEPDDTGRKLVATRSGLELFRTEYGDRPVAVVTFIGRARSGKSFGINNLLGIPHDHGFEVGHTFKPETSGALVWSDPFPGTDAGTPAVIVIDTEGLGAGAEIFDKAMLAVTSAISSRLVYHMMGYVYTEDVLRLHGLACLVEDYRRREIRTDAVLPHITWVVNKNDLQRSASSQTAAQVLFDTPLAERRNLDSNAHIARFNATVRVVREAFHDHVVHLVPTAAPPGVECTALTQYAFDDLAPGYRAEMEVLRAELAQVAPRLVPGAVPPHGAPMTGADVANLIELVLPAANEGLEHVGDRMAEAIARRRLEEAKAEIEKTVRERAYPVEECELERLLQELELATLAKYRPLDAAGALASLLASYERELSEKIRAENMHAKMLNSDASDAMCAGVADAAAQLFAHDRLTNNGAITLKLAAFDVAVASAKAKYERAAVGPRKSFHAAQLTAKARAARESAIAETAPMMRQVWLGAALVVAFICYVMRRATRMFEWGLLRTTSNLLEAAQLLAIVLAALAVASMFGFELVVSFETVADTLTAIYTAGAGHYIILLISACTAFCIAVALMVCGTSRGNNAADTRSVSFKG